LDSEQEQEVLRDQLNIKILIVNFWVTNNLQSF